MKQQDDIYNETARFIEESDDPRATLLELARFLSKAERRRKRTWGLAIVVLAGITGFTLFGRRKEDSSAWTPEQRATWAREQNRIPPNESLTPEAITRLRTYLRDENMRIRRIALLALANHQVPVDVEAIADLLRGSLETLDRPEPLADSDGGIATTLRLKRIKTLRAATLAAHMHAAREKTFPYLELLERAARHYDSMVSIRAIRALNEIPEYQLSASLAATVRAKPDTVREEAKALLERGIRKEKEK